MPYDKYEMVVHAETSGALAKNIIQTIAKFHEEQPFGTGKHAQVIISAALIEVVAYMDGIVINFPSTVDMTTCSGFGIRHVLGAVFKL